MHLLRELERELDQARSAAVGRAPVPHFGVEALYADLSDVDTELHPATSCCAPQPASRE